MSAAAAFGAVCPASAPAFPTSSWPPDSCKPLTPAIKALIDDRQVPLFKLSWQADRHSQPGCTLDYLLHRPQPARKPARQSVNS